MAATDSGWLRSVDGLDLAYTVHRDAASVPEATTRLPVVLLHGLSQQRHFWGPVVARLHARPVVALDQRGHGDSDTPLDADYSIAACAQDVGALLDMLGWARAVVVGHSWGATVALRAGAILPGRVTGVALVDGGLWSPARLGPRDEVRVQLTPPSLGVPRDELWSMVRQGELGRGWSDERQAALAPTFVEADDGTLRTRIGMDRHMAVLDGLLDADPEPDLATLEAAGTPVWAAVCEARVQPRSDPHDDAGVDPGPAGRWLGSRTASVASAAGRSNLLVHRWSGAVHDVPLQWPSLVAGFIDALVDDLDGDRA